MKSIRRFILFLDLDGVVNSHRFWKLFPNDQVDPDVCARLNKWIHDHSMEVVITSTWRTPFVDPFNLDGLKKAIPFIDNIVSMTMDLDIPNGRSGEIKAWLSENGPVDAFVILDDCGNLDNSEEFSCGFKFEDDLSKNAILIDPNVGLTDQDLIRAQDSLRDQVSFFRGIAHAPIDFGKMK